MLLLEARNIKKAFAERDIIMFDELTIYQGDRIGIVGANGVGKTTLLELLAGNLEADEGFVKTYCTISYCKQFTDKKEAQENETCDKEEKDYEATRDQFRLWKEFKVSDKVSQEIVSGGEATKLKLIDTLHNKKDCVFLDEPTANLDIESTKQFLKKLLDIETFLIISHDRSLLNQACNKIMEIEAGKITMFVGNYDAYEATKQAKRERMEKEYESYIAEKQRLEKVYLDKRKRADAVVKLKKGMDPREAHLNDFLSTSRCQDSKQNSLNRNANAVLKRIENLEVKEKPRKERTMWLNFALTNPPENQYIIRGEKMDKAYGQRLIFQDASILIPNYAKIAVVGPNGCGKTTLLNMLWEAYHKKDDKTIQFVPRARMGYFYQNFENICMDKSVYENTMSEAVQTKESVYSLLAKLLFTVKDCNKLAYMLSGGERIKLALAKLFASPNNVLMLDEPTNYLDLPSIIALQNMIKEYEGTILFVSHDEKFVNETANYLLLIQDYKLKLFHGNLAKYYEELKIREAREKQKVNQTIENEKMMLELKKTELLGRMGSKRVDKEKILLEYDEVCKRLNQIS